MTRSKTIKIGGIVLGIMGAFFIFQLALNLPTNQPNIAEAVSSSYKEGTVVVSGTGEVKVKPDLAYVHFGAQVTSSSAEEAQKKVSERITAVRKVLEKYEIDEKQIQTSRFHVFPYQNYNADGTTGKEQYRAEHMLRVEFHDIDRVGELIDHVSAAGANQIEHIQFGLQNSDHAEQEALKKAVEKASTKADVLAESVGKTRGEIIQITDQAAQMNFPTQNYAKEESMEEYDSNQGQTSIEAGEVQATQHVDIVYSLKN
ncbi:SIMPL domain-containing protein [Bacillus solitudinis]|uniref:SIMPL domain-containing protein n=1 Tax=Bacillus solitudinis TaxID=2014074 RepID=UPI000C2423C4|nr:SIMPL domain-containing protein [Bacillus solitudinis]